jgi:hypothetical protein
MTEGKSAKPTEAQEAAEEFTAIVGGPEVDVTFRSAESFDEAELKDLEKFRDLFGTTTRVKVWDVRAKKIPAYHVLLFGNDEEALAEFFCRQPAGWGALLDANSLSLIIDTGQERNHDFWSAWFRRTMKRNEAVMPGTTDIVARALAAVAGQSGRPAPSKSASPSAGASPAPR